MPRLFKALSDPKRVSLLVRLAEEREPCTVSQLARGSGVDLSVVSRHLAILREAGIITCVKRGREVRCAVRPEGLVQVLRGLADALEACCPRGIAVGPEGSPSPQRPPARGPGGPRRSVA